MKAKPLRESMPSIAAWIDELRSVFGTMEIDRQISRGIKGEPTFWAVENGVEIGTRRPGGAGLSVEEYLKR